MYSRAAARRLGARDEDVDLSLGAIPHVIHKLDLRLQEVDIAVLTVEKHLDLRGRLLTGGFEVGSNEAERE